ncbi:MAG: nucleoside-diphosphate kinase [Elusimicrobia bacterium]|nr:nucleoside-diphosphate kinase [Elusimicrobiota bacterium]
MQKQATLVLIKPDGLKKSLTGNIMSKLAESKLVIIGARVARPDRKLVEIHYQHLKDKPFFSGLVDYLQGKLHGEPYDRVLAFVYYGENAIEKVRKIVGATNPEEAEPTTIRGSYGRIMTSGLFENVVHASSDPADAEREIKLWFKPDELVVDLYPAKPCAHNNQPALDWA